MSSWTCRTIFVLAFVAASLAFRFGYRRVKRMGRPESIGGMLRLAFRVSMALLVGCSGGRTGGTAATAGEVSVADASAQASPLGPDFDATWSDLMALWREAGEYQPGVVTTEQLDDARGRLDGLLARLAGIGAVTSDAPGLVALARIEFGARLEMMPSGVTCYEPMPVRADGAEAYERIAARADAVEELATKGYLNDWVRTVVLDRLREEVAEVRGAMAAGDAWRTEDYAIRQVDPAQIERIVARVEAAIARLDGRQE